MRLSLTPCSSSSIAAAAASWPGVAVAQNLSIASLEKYIILALSLNSLASSAFKAITCPPIPNARSYSGRSTGSSYAMAPPAQRAAATATDAASTLPVAMSAISMAVTVASHPRTATSSLMVLRLARRSLLSLPSRWLLGMSGMHALTLLFVHPPGLLQSVAIWLAGCDESEGASP